MTSGRATEQQRLGNMSSHIEDAVNAAITQTGGIEDIMRLVIAQVSTTKAPSSWLRDFHAYLEGRRHKKFAERILFFSLA
jgi:hypothetical protein